MNKAGNPLFNIQNTLRAGLAAITLGGVSLPISDAMAQTRQRADFINLQPGEIMPGVQGQSNNPFDNGARITPLNQNQLKQKEAQTSSGKIFNAFPNGEKDARALQSFLKSQGHNLGVDGQWGPASQTALNRYEKERGLTPSSGFSIPQITYEAVVNDMMKQRLELGLQFLNGKPALQVAYAAIFSSRFGVDARGTYGKEIQQIIATAGVQVGKNGVLKVSAADLRKFEELYFPGVPDRVGTTLKQNAFGVEYTQKTDDYNSLLQEIGGGLVYFDAKGKNLGKVADIIKDGYNVGEIRGAWTGGKRVDAFVKAAFKLHPNIRLDGTVGWYQAKEGNILDYVGKSTSGLTISGKLNVLLDEQNRVYALGRWDGNNRWSVGGGYERALAPGINAGLEYRYDNPVNGTPANHSVMTKLSGKFSTGQGGITFGDGSKETKLPPLFRGPTTNQNGSRVNILSPRDGLTFGDLATVNGVNIQRIIAGRAVTARVEKQNAATIKNKPTISSVTPTTVTCSGSIEDTDGVRNQMFELLSSTGGVLQRQASCNFAGLAAGTQYSVRVVGEAYDARKQIWESAISEATSFNTLIGNSNPKANPDNSTTPYNTPTTLNVVANDTDSDGDSLTIHLNPTSSNGLVSLSSDKKSITFTPNMGFTGTATVNYTISDGKGGFSSSVWTITVQPLVNQAPVFVSSVGNQATTLGNACDIQLPGATDTNGDTLTYNATGLPVGCSFDPLTKKIIGNPTTTGTYTVTYTVSDNKGGIDTKVFTYIINEALNATPNTFNFVDQTGVDVSTVTESNSITVSGINTSAPISITGGEYSINGGAWTSAGGTVTNGQTVKVRLTSSSTRGTIKSAVLSIGGVTDSFDVTTKINTAPQISSGGESDLNGGAIGPITFSSGLVSDDTTPFNQLKIQFSNPDTSLGNVLVDGVLAKVGKSYPITSTFSYRAKTTGFVDVTDDILWNVIDTEGLPSSTATHKVKNLTGA